MLDTFSTLGAWAGALALILLPALGHLYHFVLLVNVGSGMGLREHTMDRIRSVLLLVLLGTAALMIARHFERPWWTWSAPYLAYPALCLASGAVFWPWQSYRLAARKAPRGVSGRTQVLDLAAGPGGPEAFIGPGRKAWELRLPRHDAFRLSLHEFDLEFPGLPPALDGLRIVQLTDLHLARCYRREFFERVAASAAGWEADLVAVTGDLVEDEHCIEWIEPVLGPLRARLARFVILGNHDADHGPERIKAELRRIGYEPVDARWVGLELEGATLAIGGTSAPWGPRLDAEEMPPADFRLLLSHSPDQFYVASRRGVDLVLAGHNHGGQVRLPLVGPVFMPSRYSRRFDRGFFRRRSTLMYVSEGIGGKHPVRYGCPPEVALFTLRCKLGPRPSPLAGVLAHAPREAALGADRFR